MPDTNREIWLKVYTAELTRLYGDNAPWLARITVDLQRPTVAETLRAWAEKMTEGLPAIAANKDSEAVKCTCKILGLKHTYKAIRAFLDAPPTSLEISQPDPWARFVAEIALALNTPILLSGMDRPCIRSIISYAEDRYTVTLPYTEYRNDQNSPTAHGWKRQEFLTQDDADAFAVECRARGQRGVYITTPAEAVVSNARLAS